MVKNNNAKLNTETVQTPNEDKQSTPVVEKQKTGLKKSTIITGILLLGAAAVWGVVGYQTMQSENGNTLFSKYFSHDESDVTVARIDGKDIYLSDIKAIAKRVPQLAELPFDMIYPRLLQEYVATEVVLKSAQEAEVQKDPLVREAIKDARNTILSKAYLEKRIDELATPEKLKELYLEEIKNVERQDEIHARHILVRTEKEAKDVLIQLKAGADFQMLANTKSLDTESAAGGDLGYFKKNMMIPEFSEAVFALKKGQLSQPIKTPFGWHVVLVEDRRLAAPPAFEEVQDQLRQLFIERNIQNILKQEEQKHNVEFLVTSLQQPDTATVLQQSQPEAVEVIEGTSTITETAPVEPVAAQPGVKAEAEKTAETKAETK